MTGTAMTFGDEFVTKQATKLSTKNAWALYVRRRWPQNTVKAVEAEWGLSNGEARNVVFARISQATIDKIIEHKNGGMGLGLLILEIKCQQALADFIEKEKGRNAKLRADLETRDRVLSEMLSDVRSFAPVGNRRRRRKGSGPSVDLDA